MGDLTNVLSSLHVEADGLKESIPTAVVKALRTLIVRNQQNGEVSRKQADGIPFFLYRTALTIDAPNNPVTSLRHLINRATINEQGDHIWVDPNPVNPSVEFL